MKKNRPLIWVIDDDTAILEALKLSLEEEGFLVRTDTQAGLIRNFDDNNLPDLIIIDYLLSEEDGIKLARKIKKGKLSRKIPIIIISAHPSACHECKENGLKLFLAKPFDLNTLIRLVKQNLN